MKETRRAWLFDLREAVLAMHYFGVTFLVGLSAVILLVTLGVIYEFLCLSVFLSIAVAAAISLIVLWAYRDYKNDRP